MAQKIILFENILNGDSILNSKEITALSNHQFGESNLSLGETNKPEDFHDWLNNELQKAISGGYCQIYKMKAPFADIKGEDESGEYSAPVNVFLFEPDAAIDDGILLLTCNWKGGLIRNDHYVCGVVADEGDIERILESEVDGKLVSVSTSKRIKDEAKCQELFDELFQEVDKYYQAFVKREPPYNRPNEPQNSFLDRNWLSFTSRVTNTLADKYLRQMGLNEDEAYDLYHDFDSCFEVEEFEQALKKNTELFNRPIAELYYILCKIYKDMSEKYIYVEESK